MPKEEKYSEPVLVKMNQELYEQVRQKVKENSIEYPSIKHFVEIAVMHTLGFKKYDIEGVNQEFIEKEPLKNLVKNYASCSFCTKFFLKNKEDKGDFAKVCSSCKLAIINLAEQLRGDKK